MTRRPTPALSTATGSAPWRPALLAVLLLLATPPTRAAGQSASPTARASVSADSVRVGERFLLTVAMPDGGGEVLYPAPSDSAAFGDLVVIARVPSPMEASGRAATYEVAAFAVDVAVLPPLPVRLVADGDTTLVRTQPLRIPVIATLPEDATELRPPTPPVAFDRPLWPWLAGGLAALALLALLAYALRRRMEASPAAPERRTPYEQAAERLGRLDAGGLTPDAAKPFYTALTDALRTYLQRRLGVPARERTTRELLHALRRPPYATALPDGADDRLEELLRRADLVKFADRHPAAEAAAAALGEARSLLEAVEQHVTAREEAARKEAARHAAETRNRVGSKNGRRDETTSGGKEEPTTE